MERDELTARLGKVQAKAAKANENLLEYQQRELDLKQVDATRPTAVRFESPRRLRVEGRSFVDEEDVATLRAKLQRSNTELMQRQQEVITLQQQLRELVPAQTAEGDLEQAKAAWKESHARPLRRPLS